MPRKKLIKFNNLKKVPGALDIGYVYEVRDLRIPIARAFRRTAVELGCGSGDLLREYAMRHQDTYCIGFDLQGERIYDAAISAHARGISNTLFVRASANQISYFFSFSSLDEVWVTFPDPFPKKENDKRRLTHRRFLHLYHDLLKSGGVLHFKTDDKKLYEFTLGELSASGKFTVQESGVLAPHEVRDVGIQTKFERTYRLLGRTIYFVIAKPLSTSKRSRNEQISLQA